jgi:hypothetical protein
MKAIRAYADEKEIVLPFGVTKADALKLIDELDSDLMSEGEITAPTTEVEQTALERNNVIGPPKVEKATKSDYTPPVREKEVIWSDRSLYLIGIGGVNKGYNLLWASQVEPFLLERGIRRCTDEELKEYYGRK